MLCISDSECVTKMTPYSIITVYREMIALPFYYRPFACIVSRQIILLFIILENNTIMSGQIWNGAKLFACVKWQK